MPDLPLIEILYSALHEELGVLVHSNDAERLRQRLYAERKSDPKLANLSLVLSRTDPKHLLLVIRKPEEPENGENEE